MQADLQLVYETGDISSAVQTSGLSDTFKPEAASVSESSAGWCLAAPGVRRLRCPTPRSIPSELRSSCRAVFITAPLGDRVVLPETRRHRVDLSAPMGRVHRAHPKGGMARHAAALLQAPHAHQGRRCRVRRAPGFIWQGASSYLRTNPDYVARFKEGAYAAACARIECHYFINQGFFRSDTQLHDEVGKIAGFQQ
jgi:hypothetical protein